MKKFVLALGFLFALSITTFAAQMCPDGRWHASCGMCPDGSWGCGGGSGGGMCPDGTWGCSGGAQMCPDGSWHSSCGMCPDGRWGCKPSDADILLEFRNRSEHPRVPTWCELNPYSPACTPGSGPNAQDECMRNPIADGCQPGR